MNLQGPRVAPDRKEREALTLGSPGEQREFGHDDGSSIRLWDNIDSTWTSPIPMEQKDLHLQKGVFKCSACRFTTINIGGDHGLYGHIESVRKRVTSHRNATLQAFQNEKGQRIGCSGCVATFQDRDKGERHLEDWSQRVLDEHKGATRITVQRFSLGPPPESSNGATTSVDVSVAPKAETPQPRQRRRRRGKRGGQRR